MSLQIKPLGNIIHLGELTDVAIDINLRVNDPSSLELLRSRHMVKIRKQYEGRLKTAENSVHAARRLHTASVLGVYTLRFRDRYVGLATVDPQPKLHRQLISLPPRLARGPLNHGLSLPGPKVSVWVAPTHGLDGLNNLAAVYRQLKDPQGLARPFYDRFSAETDQPVRAWTIEPLDAPQWIHAAISQAGFQGGLSDVGHYDDGESRRHAPPVSRLYIAPSLR